MISNDTQSRRCLHPLQTMRAAARLMLVATLPGYSQLFSRRMFADYAQNCSFCDSLPCLLGRPSDPRHLIQGLRIKGDDTVRFLLPTTPHLSKTQNPAIGSFAQRTDERNPYSGSHTAFLRANRRVLVRKGYL